MTIDSHQHFWHYIPERDTWITPEMKKIQRDFLPSDLKSILGKNKIGGSVTVQVDQSEKETERMIRLASENKFIKGVVGWTDLRSPGVQARLEYYSQFPAVKGFRHIVQGEPDSFLLRRDFCRGIALLKDYGFTYDILIYPQHLEDAIRFVRKFPDQKFVVDHLAKPVIRKNQIGSWKKGMKLLASHENVWCKLSGMVTEADWRRWKPGDFTPYLDAVLESFGTRRLMYGSDWPVCLLAASYEKQLTIVKNFIRKLSESEKAGILGENAAAFYHL